MCMGGGGGSMSPLIQIVQQPLKAPTKGGTSRESASAGGSSQGAAASTLLTGPDGIDIAKLQLAKNTLLGM